MTDRTENAPRDDESEEEREDRNLIELLNELRVSGTGIQVMLAFLLVVPFNTGYKHMTSFDKAVYFGALGCIAGAAALLIAPSVHHRLLFHHRQRPFIIAIANRCAIAGTVLLGVGLAGIIVLIANVVYGTAAALAAGIVASAFVFVLWFAVPLVRRARVGPRDRRGYRLTR